MSEKNQNSIYYAHEYLEAKFNNGEFDQMIVHLFERLGDNRDHLLSMIKEAHAQSDEEKLAIVEKFLKERKSVHLPSELASQIQEISKEVWIRGEKGEENVPQIKEEWAQKHASSWRQARVIEMQFLLYRLKEKVLELLK